MTLPAVDLDYDLAEDIVPGVWHRDSLFVFKRVEEAVRAAIGRPPAVDGRGPPRLLDVACGTADQAGHMSRLGWQSWGLEPSNGMLRLAGLRRAERGESVALVRAIAERIPFPDDTFDCAVCQGSLDHFAQPEAFLAEVARVVKPGGRVVIALANYESLSCRIARLVHHLRVRFGIAEKPGRQYWQIPPNHTFKGDLPVLRRLAGPWLRIETLHGVSMLWLVRRWSLLLDGLPESGADALLRTFDSIAYRAPALSDMLIAIARPRKEPP